MYSMSEFDQRPPMIKVSYRNLVFGVTQARCSSRSWSGSADAVWVFGGGGGEVKVSVTMEGAGCLHVHGSVRPASATRRRKLPCLASSPLQWLALFLLWFVSARARVMIRAVLSSLRARQRGSSELVDVSYLITYAKKTISQKISC